jgi:hypothetical protein
MLLFAVIAVSMQTVHGMDEKNEYDKQTVRLEYWIPNDPAKRAEILKDHKTAETLQTYIDTMLSTITLSSGDKAKEQQYLEDEGIIEGGLLDLSFKINQPGDKQPNNNNEWSFFYGKNNREMKK